MNTLAIDELRRHLRCPIISRSDSGFERARRVWNAMIDRHPLLVVQPETTQDIAAAIAFARQNSLPLTVKGGGHGVAGKAVCDDGLVIDLSRMGAGSVDASARIASVQGGATLRTLDAAAQAHGLATTAGIYRLTGVAGLALGGGVGLLMRRHGLTCDNLLAAEVVTADGQILETNETDHPDLFWALRGGGGNFGVVTRMDFRLHPLTTVYGGRIRFSFADAAKLGEVYTEVMTDAADELQVYLSFGSGAEEKSASLLICECGDGCLGAATRDRFTRACRPTSDEVAAMPYLQMQQHWDDTFPDGRRHYWKSSFLREISEDVVRVCAEAVARQPLPDCNVDLEPMGGAIAQVAPDAMAFADRDAASTLLIATTWTNQDETDARIAWVRETWASLQPYCKPSTYINYMDEGDEDRTEATYGTNLHRLVAIKRKYDPDNIFQPTGSIQA